MSLNCALANHRLLCAMDAPSDAAAWRCSGEASAIQIKGIPGRHLIHPPRGVGANQSSACFFSCQSAFDRVLSVFVTIFPSARSGSAPVGVKFSDGIACGHG